jgi:hypothetical protein
MPSFKTTAQQVAEGAARKDDRDGPETEYRLKVRARVPLADAGQATTVRVTGKATKRELTKQLEKEGYEVERVEKKKGLFWW